MAGELLNELQTICTQGAIEESGEKIERLKTACHTKLSETESGTWYLRCSVSLSFVDEEVYNIMYRYDDVTSYDVTSNDVGVERHSDFELDLRLLM